MYYLQYTHVPQYATHLGNQSISYTYSTYFLNTEAYNCQESIHKNKHECVFVICNAYSDYQRI